MKKGDNQSGNSIVRGFSDSGLDVMEGEEYMIDTKERIIMIILKAFSMQLARQLLRTVHSLHL